MAQPSVNIRGHLEDCLGKWDFDSAYSYNRTFNDAPNPALYLEGLGTVGLPLSERDAAAIKGCAAQAPFGMGERTVVDKSVRDTWEMDATQVKFSNLDWQSFMTRVVNEACATLGVNVKASRPRCDLYKLLLYETGSHFLPHVDTEKADGMFATIIVVLPSQFTGGAAHLSHDGVSTVYDCSSTSLLQTTAMAWYTDVTHEIKPVTSGYRLALAYNLVHTNTSLRPAVSSSEPSMNRLRDILRSWTQDNGATAPSKIIHLLEHKYSQANLCASALKGADANKVAVLDEIAHELGFHLGLASVVCALEGYADDDGPRNRRNCYWDEDSEDDDEVGFAEIESKTMTIEDFVDMDGEVISEGLAFNEKTETIPVNLAKIIEAGDHDEQEYEGYMGNGAGSLSRWYRRTVLVIWPKYSNFAIQYGEENIERACKTLSSFQHASPEADDLALADFVLARAAKNPAAAAQSVCHAALMWKSSELWVRAVQTCSPVGNKGLALFPNPSRIVEAISTLGFSEVKSGLEKMLHVDLRNAARFAFLDAVESWNSVRNSQEITNAILPWVVSSRHMLLENLRPPSVEDQLPFVSLALKQGSVTFLRDSILPKIKGTATSDILRGLAVMAHDEQRFTDSAEVKAQVTSEIMQVAISRTLFTEVVKTPTMAAAYTYGYSRTANVPLVVKNPNYERARATMGVCMTRFPQLTASVFDKVMDTQALSVFDVEKQVKEVMLPLLQFVAEQLSTTPENAPPVGTDKLLRVAMEAYVKTVSADVKATKTEDVQSIVMAATLPGGPKLFATMVLPKLEKLKFSPDIVRSFIDELRSHRDKIVFPADHTGPTLESSITVLSKMYANSAPLTDHQVIGDALQYCLRINAMEACTLIIKRIVEAKSLSPTYVSKVLVPFIPELRRIAVQYNMLDGFAPAFQTIMLAWIEKVLGQKPKNDGRAELASLASWTCTCAECNPIRKFLQSGAQQSTSLSSIGAPRRKHLEGYLARYARLACSWQTISTVPQGIQVTKSPAVWQPALWKAVQGQGQAILKTVSGNEEELARILGTHYRSITTILRGTPGTAVPSETPQGSASSAGGSAAGRRQRSPEITQNPSTAAQPPAKKRKTASYNTSDVIDLTSP
ncbi:hypothetical protein EIP91_010648 [Steccherinum ochraceum]|uniref:Fe2OG dioxygenase domain-containing protein n=1 Tax=Steccherinum ochraceum TaxID=92696 RepID=A0A4R0RN50_9APHY|nr:hypothetical protein EIP91_010648 [Steccherinum ochraceum]